MTAAVAVPVRASVRDLLRDVAGAEVVVSGGVEQALGEGPAAQLAAYVHDDDTAVAALVVSFPAALSLAAAAADLTATQAMELVDGDGLGGDLHDRFVDVADRFAAVLNGPATRRVRLRAVHAVPGEVPEDVAALVLAPRVRVDWSLAVDGHDGGVATLVTA